MHNHIVIEINSPSPPLQDCIPQFAELWRQIFRVMDDVHEGTRHAAVTTGKTLSAICIRHLEIGDKAGLALVETIFPVILDQGVYSTVQDVVKVRYDCTSILPMKSQCTCFMFSKSPITFLPTCKYFLDLHIIPCQNIRSFNKNYQVLKKTPQNRL